jgi:superfamily II DNA or RNA helicase
MPQKLPRLHAGVLVDARGDRWRVVELLAHEDCDACRLRGAGASNAGVVRTLLLPFDRPRPVAQPTRLVRVGRRRWMRALRSALASDVAFDGLRGAAHARLDLHAYQLEPALACAGGAMRVLIADEVGLGKTVQAGLILADLAARTWSARALVLAPSGLCAQWVDELRDRFGLPAVHVDAGALARMARESAAAASPWERVRVAVASIDFVKRPEVLQGTSTDRWDALVVDEAHLAALAPERAAAVGWLARRSRRVVLLTATPHSGDVVAFDALCGIGRLPGEGPIAIFRRTRASLDLPASRRVRVLRVRLSAFERHMHAGLERYTNRVWREASAGGASAEARLAMIVLRKRAASGVAPLLASLSRRLRWISCPDEAAAEQLALPLGPDADEAEAADAEPGSVLSAPGLLDADAERSTLERLLDLARAALPHDSKTRVLTRLLARAAEPAIVFTEYRDTLAGLAERLAPSAPVAILHGGLDRAARLEAVAAFTTGRARLLLATDAAAHGLNLHARCRLVIDLELPWNPTRLEQRIGRVDRIGQRRTVHAVHLVAGGTSEDHVLARLSARVERARQALGPDGWDALAALPESRVADGVFARRAPWPEVNAAADAAIPVSASRPSEPAQLEAARLGRIRRMSDIGPGSSRDVRRALERTSPWWAAVGRRRAVAGLPRGVLCVYVAEVVDGCGQSVEEFPVVLSVAAASISPGVRPGRRALLPRAGTGLRRAFDAEARRAAARRVVELQTAAAPRLAFLRRRDEALEAVCERVPVVAVQPGLFDRRALAAADRRRDDRRRQEAAAVSRLGALARASRLALAGAPRLLLALVVW